MKRTNAIAWAAMLLLVAGVGCVKSISSHSSTTTSSTAVTDTSGNRIVYTPFGPRHASDVVLIEKGYHLRYDGDHLLKVDGSGKTVLDLGVQKPLPYLVQTGKGAKMVEGAGGTSGNVPALGSGWITYASNPPLSPVTYFTTTWTVPTAPATSEGQLLYLFNGLQDGLSGSSHIFQPVLQWGLGPEGGGPNWYVDNWYASCQGCTALVMTPPVQVNPGTSLTGVMQQTGQSGGSYSYTSSFTGAAYNAVTLNVGGVPPLTYPFETMEAYGMQQASDYPADNYVRMSNINIQTGTNSYPVLGWQFGDNVTDIGQHTIIVSDQNPGGDVDLYFHSAPAITGSGSFVYSLSSPSGSGTITGPAGRYVFISLRATGLGTGGYSFTLNVSLNGANYAAKGSNVLSVTNGVITDGFYMPASGSVTWTASFSGTVGRTGTGSLGIQ